MAGLPFTRRHLAQLGAVALGGWAVGHLIDRAWPIGRDVDGAAAAAATDDLGSPTSGPAAASVRMAVFTDYRCPPCRRAYPAMEAATRADGDVLTIYKDWPIFGAVSERAARVALASAEQGIYPAMHRRLMTDARTVTDRMLRDVVIDAGGDWERLTAYLAAHDDRVTARLRTNGLQALALGLRGTPAFLAGSVLAVGAMDEADFARLFARARALAAHEMS